MLLIDLHSQQCPALLLGQNIQNAISWQISLAASIKAAATTARGVSQGLGHPGSMTVALVDLMHE